MSHRLRDATHAPLRPDRCGEAEQAVCSSNPRRGGAAWMMDEWSWLALQTKEARGGSAEVTATLSALEHTPKSVCVVPPPAVGIVLAGGDGPIGHYITGSEAEALREAAADRCIHLWYRPNRAPIWAQQANQRQVQNVRALARIFSRKVSDWGRDHPGEAGPGYNPTPEKTEIVDVWVDASVDAERQWGAVGVWLSEDRYDGAGGSFRPQTPTDPPGEVTRAETHAIWQAIAANQTRKRLRIHSDNPFAAHGWWGHPPSGYRAEQVKEAWREAAVVWTNGDASRGIWGADRAAYSARLRSQYGDLAHPPHNVTPPGLGDGWGPVTWELDSEEAELAA